MWLAATRQLPTLLVQLLLLLLQLARAAQAGCARLENPDLVEYSCEGGSAEDLKLVPSNAEKLRISGMPLGRLDEGSFARFPELLVLTCSHCRISDIDDRAFRRLSNLQQLSLDNNQLKEVRAAWFQGLGYLTYLDLNYNGIERIEPEVFRNAPELVDLRLSGNRLLCLDLEALSRLRDLKRVFINENPNFGCPNALKRFLSERRVDFEADPQWNGLVEDRVRASEPLPPAPAEERFPTTYQPPRGRWNLPVEQPEEVPAEAPTAAPTLPPAPRRPYVPEMMQPSVPEQEFPLQGPYYAPKLPSQQQLDSYREGLLQQAQNASEATKNRTLEGLANATLPTIRVAGQQLPPTTECPNAAAALRRPAAASERLLLGFALLLGALLRRS